MDFKKFWYFIPTIIFPFFIIAVPVTIFFSSSKPILGFIMDTICQGNPYLLIALLIPIGLAAVVLNFIGTIKAIHENWDSQQLANYALITKLIYLPVYGIVFPACAVLAFSLIFSPLHLLLLWPIPVGLFLLNTLTLFLSNLITTAAVVNANREGLYTSKESAKIVILQLFYYLDIVAAIIFYRKLMARCTGKTL